MKRQKQLRRIYILNRMESVVSELAKAKLKQLNVAERVTVASGDFEKTNLL